MCCHWYHLYALDMIRTMVVIMFHSPVRTVLMVVPTTMATMMHTNGDLSNSSMYLMSNSSIFIVLSPEK